MEIKEIIEFKNMTNVTIKLDIKKRMLSITCTDDIKKQIIYFRILSAKNLHVITNKKKSITLYNIISYAINKKNIYIKFDCIYIGANLEEDRISNVGKYIVKFNSNVKIVNQNKKIQYKCYKIVLKSYSVEILNETQSIDSEEYFKEFLNIYELIFLINGYFPEIKNVELHVGTDIIKEYRNLAYLYYSSCEMIKNSYLLTDINKIDNFQEIIELFKTLKGSVKNYPIYGLFISQMQYNYYLEYKLAILLQSIDGYCSNKYSINEKSTKDKKIIQKLTDSIMADNELKDGDKKKICNYINNYHNPCFKDKLKDLIDDNKNSKKIFKEEIELERICKENIGFEKECKLYDTMDNFLTKTVNERNKISHMSKKDCVFNSLQRIIVYNKWLLIYRIVLINELDININEEKLEKCIKDIRNINKQTNIEICERCNNKQKCKVINI